MAAQSKSEKALYVTAALVSFHTEDGGVRQARWGDVVTPDVTDESIKHHQELGYVSDKDPREALGK